MYDVIVIGGGPAGVTAALRTGISVAALALVERGHMGGTCTNDGCVPTHVLAKAARLIHDIEQFDGIWADGTTPFPKNDRLLARTQHIVYAIQEKKQLINHLQTSGAEVVRQSQSGAFYRSTHFIELPETAASFKPRKYILCAGGHARRLDFPGAQYAMTHSDVWSFKTSAALPSWIRRRRSNRLPARFNFQRLWGKSYHPGGWRTLAAGRRCDGFRNH